MIELTIRMKNAERTQVEKHLIYEQNQMQLSPSDKILAQLIADAEKKFDDDIDECVVTAKLRL